MTEEEFLAAYNPGNWPKPSLTADVCVFRRGPGGEGWELLLIERGGHPYRGCWALPGGFSEPGEDIDQTAARELAEETGLDGVPIERTYVYSGPGRDPRCWVATQAFMCVGDDSWIVQAGDDAAKAVFFRLKVQRSADRLHMQLEGASEVLEIDCATSPQPYSGIHRAVDAQGTGLAFDHARVIADAYLYLVHVAAPQAGRV